MGCRSILTVAVVAAGLFGADASPCKPATSTAVSVVQSEALSTVASEVTSSVLVETSLTLSTETTSTAEGSSSTILETSLTTLAETTAIADATTSSALIEETPTTLAASTTTIEAESCIETQVVVNPGFDDNNDGSPWIHDGQVKSDYTPSNPNNLEVTVYNGPPQSISQTLHNIKAGEYQLSFRWRITWVDNDSGSYNCYIIPRIGTSRLLSVFANDPSDMYAHSTGFWPAFQDLDEVNLSLQVVCTGTGDFSSVIFNFDDVTLTKVCDVDL
ncbi:uncharacterized protein FIESC28_02800 [Fusarium coffeatum]|uniref:CBM-cenC domain-containing protein n=1 Tax=Fusarium coffeatum TaxID=231269 RepID=A0A366S6K5_9HYPO|nr:uncharacterized protein FIESC28_02800 [Fusarium coffeatum]RBR24310.1 hypothetical protein FIESC28_02800 [Fusarium coffeatum]